ncbi:MAG: fimbria/pilus periplasmic chaperone [Proteobacteria bacterium]|nr:fimbria/pilus periplasmic chaperone [Pseudomonadota bacterium]
MITPTRIVFEERTRTAQVTLMNNGTESGNYRISFINQNMTDDGKFEPVEEGTEGMFSNSMVRYSPRQITLPPGQSQVVRLMLRKPRELEDGEYRSHMLFQSLPKANKSSLESAVKKEAKNITVEIIPIVGISIPVIVRKGNINSKLTLSDTKIITGDNTNPKTRIGVTMHRTGESSIYGDFRVIYTPKDGLPTIVGLSNGVAVYTPNTIRHYKIPLTAGSDVKITDGDLRIVFLESGKNEENGLIAETNLALK